MVDVPTPPAASAPQTDPAAASDVTPVKKDKPRKAEIGIRDWTKICAALAGILFFGMLVRYFYVRAHVDRFPCDTLASEIASSAKAKTPLPQFAPTELILGAPVCLAVPAETRTVDGKPVPVYLFLNDLKLTSSTGTLASHDQNFMVFDVTRTSGPDASVWQKIIGEPGWGPDGASAGTVLLHVGAGSGDSASVTADKKLALTIVDPVEFLLGLATFAAAVLGLTLTARESAILRDGDNMTRFSLARVQMAFWLYLVTAGFVYIWLITGEYNSVITAQALTLLGISGTTGVMAIAIDKNPPVASTGFWNDILTDGTGPALHRIQVVVWNTILGVVFCTEIYNKLQLPTFDPNLLILLGISGLTYIGFKFNE